jgi:hypothetical protein
VSEPGEPAGIPGPEAILAERISCEGGYRSFGEMTLADVRSRAEELSAAAEVSAMARRTGPVAAAWRGLADEMERGGAETVAGLDRATITERAERLWVIPPGGSLL